MLFRESDLPGAWVIEIEPHEDERGFLARTSCVEEFERHGLTGAFQQCSISYNRAMGTLRGLHFQAPPHEEAKLVRCTRGRILDVVVDIRQGGPTFGKWFGVELSDSERNALYVPEGFAHGFITLEAETEVFYQISKAFVAGAGRGIRWNDPQIGIAWPLVPAVISERDAELPFLDSLYD